MDTQINHNMMSFLLNDESINDINYKLLTSIYDNEITTIINIFKYHKSKIWYKLKDNEGNSLLMLTIKYIKPITINFFQCTCPFYQTKTYTILDIIYFFNECNINNKNTDGETALIMAIKNIKDNDMENNNIICQVINILISYDTININVQDNNGYTALMHCVKIITKQNEKHITIIIQMLLAIQHININMISNNGTNALYMIIHNHRYFMEIITLLIKNGAEIPDNMLLNDGVFLFRLGIGYRKINKSDKVKKYYSIAIQDKNMKEKIFLYYRDYVHPSSITKGDFDFINETYKKEHAFILLYKSPLLHETSECPICLEDTNNVCKLLCHHEHKICVKCINVLPKKLCPFCRNPFMIK